MPLDANPSGDIVGGRTVSEMDLEGATFAVRRSCRRVVTVAIEAMHFLRPITAGDEVSYYGSFVEEGEHSVSVKIGTSAPDRAEEAAEQVTEGVFAYAALDDHDKPRALREGSSEGAAGPLQPPGTAS
jgi:acyl-CoA thioesterase YciA